MSIETHLKQPVQNRREKTEAVLSVNWHFISRCNYHCRFCCTKNLKGECTSLQEGEKILSCIAGLGIKKINFVGGEPLCSPIWGELVKVAKKHHLVTSVTTNGSLLTAEKLTVLAPYLDWIGISLDSPDNTTEAELGRGHGDHVTRIRRIVPFIHKTGIRLKVNTTVTSRNCHENMRDLIMELNPQRWKIFQVIHVPGQNDTTVTDLMITVSEFDAFLKRHSSLILNSGSSPVFETAEEMIDSYLMVSPDGNLFSNTHYPSRSIPLELVTRDILGDFMNIERYLQRGGIYDW